MAGGDPFPIQIGARGTVGNLVMKEIEYFRRLESSGGNGDDDHGIKNSINPDNKYRGDGTSSKFWYSFGFLRKGKRKGGRFFPRMCTMVDVAESRHHRLSMIPSFSYRNLKDDINQFEV